MKFFCHVYDYIEFIKIFSKKEQCGLKVVQNSWMESLLVHKMLSAAIKIR